MKFIVFNGSPAAENSCTNIIARSFLEGAKRAGAETENVFLINKSINHCRGCFSCWFKTAGKCVIDDDMSGLIEKYNQADVVCFATPVYTWNMTAALKNFVDRLAPLKSPAIVNNGGNFDLADTKPKEQKFVVISNCGFPGENNFKIMKAVFSSCSPAFEIYRNCGKLLKSEKNEVRKRVDAYLNFVNEAGYEMAKYGYVTDKTKCGVEMKLMETDEYIKYIGM